MGACLQVEVTSEDVIGNERKFWINFTTDGGNINEIAFTLHFSSKPLNLQVSDPGQIFLEIGTIVVVFSV